MENYRYALDFIERSLIATCGENRIAGCHECIPLNPDNFLKYGRKAKQLLLKFGLKNFSFVDVGCGIGTKLVLAQELLFFRAEGVELNEKYAELARKITRNKDAIHQTDARTFHYGKYDIVYFYRPMYDGDGQKAIEKRIMDTAKKGAVIIGGAPMLLRQAWEEKLTILKDEKETAHDIRIAIKPTSDEQRQAALQHWTPDES